MTAAVRTAEADLAELADNAEEARGGGFSAVARPQTQTCEDIEAELAAGLIVRCEIGLGAGEGL